MTWTAGGLGRIVGIALAITGISFLHYWTDIEQQTLHDLYQHLYYVPILLAAFWYGPLGGVLAAALTAGLYLIHIQMHWGQLPASTLDKYIHIFIFHFMALLFGFLALQERRQRQQVENTSRKLDRANRELKQTFEQLRTADRMAALGTLSSGVAHEIRNPLGSIKGSVEILESSIDPDHKNREFLTIIKEEVVRLNSIVSQFLAFARPPEPSVQLATINELIDATILLLKKEAERSSVQILTRTAPVLPDCRVDPNQIRQVFLNVLLNGIQAMPAGGVLEVRSRFEPASKLIVVDVSDTGEGVNDAELERIFDPFYSTKPDGTGLGLSVSHQLVEQHGGRIFARNNSDSGLTVEVHLPIHGTKEKGDDPVGSTPRVPELL